MIVFILTIAASAAALLGGYAAIKSQRWLNMALALTGGLVLGLVLFDLLPEIFELINENNIDPVWPMILMAGGFLVFHFFERFVQLHPTGDKQYGPHRHPILGSARAAALTGHSFLDGLSIGVAFQANSAVGTAVALAVIGHRFADGFDTTTFMVFHKNKPSQIKGWLAVVVAMPVLGGLASLVFSLSESVLALYLGFFAGFILYIAASNILPEAHSESSFRKSAGFTVLGVILMLILTRLI